MLRTKLSPQRPAPPPVVTHRKRTTLSPAQRRLIVKARAGDSNAAYQLGMIYTSRTKNRTTSTKQSVYWFNLAAWGGHAKAQYNLAVAYAKGEGTPENPFEAFIWFHIAATQKLEGAAQARETIAHMLSPHDQALAEERASHYLSQINRKRR